MKERVSDPRIAAELARVNIKSEADVRAWYVCDEKQLGAGGRGSGHQHRRQHAYRNDRAARSVSSVAGDECNLG